MFLKSLVILFKFSYVFQEAAASESCSALWCVHQLQSYTYCHRVYEKWLVFSCCLLDRNYFIVAVIQRVHETPPKYNGVIFEILGKHHWNFYNRIQHMFVHCVQKFVEIQLKDGILLHVFNYSSKTQVSVTARTHARSQLSPMKQCHYSSIVVTLFVTKNFH